MATISEDYVSFETAKLLKEKGFNELCSHYIVSEDALSKFSHGCEFKNSDSTDNDLYCCPTQALVMKWLREVHNIHIDICSNWDIIHWIYQVFVITPRTARNSYVDKILYTSYEKAVEAGIKYALENLI